MMFFSAWSKTAKIIGATTALAVTAVPVAVLADASNPIFMPKKKAKPKPRKVAPKPRRAAAKPVVQPAPVATTVYTPPSAPVYTPPPPAPVYTPAPVEPAAPAPAPAAAPVAKSGGNGLLLGVLGAAAAIAAILVLSDGNDSPTSPG